MNETEEYNPCGQSAIAGKHPVAAAMTSALMQRQMGMPASLRELAVGRLDAARKEVAALEKAVKFLDENSSGIDVVQTLLRVLGA